MHNNKKKNLNPTNPKEKDSTFIPKPRNKKKKERNSEGVKPFHRGRSSPYQLKRNHLILPQLYLCDELQWNPFSEKNFKEGSTHKFPFLSLFLVCVFFMCQVFKKYKPLSSLMILMAYIPSQFQFSFSFFLFKIKSNQFFLNL